MVTRRFRSTQLLEWTLVPASGYRLGYLGSTVLIRMLREPSRVDRSLKSAVVGELVS